MKTKVPEAVQQAAQQMWDASNADLEEAIGQLIEDMEDRRAAGIDSDAMSFSVTLVELQESIEVTARLHAMYLAAMYHIARQRVEGRKAS